MKAQPVQTTVDTFRTLEEQKPVPPAEFYTVDVPDITAPKESVSEKPQEFYTVDDNETTSSTAKPAPEEYYVLQDDISENRRNIVALYDSTDAKGDLYSIDDSYASQSANGSYAHPAYLVQSQGAEQVLNKPAKTLPEPVKFNGQYILDEEGTRDWNTLW